MSEYHENWEALPEDVRDMHRALKSLQEEIEAVDWYHQRQVLCTDGDLKQILIHNRDEEIEHACMALEWLRRHVPAWDKELRTYLFTEAPVTEVEEKAMGGAEAEIKRDDDDRCSGLGIGDLK
ncbi:ferritin-like domain-containing protein [bacterium]|nr:ferritin-like domain-containing protein [bacterium]